MQNINNAAVAVLLPVVIQLGSPGDIDLLAKRALSVAGKAGWVSSQS